MSHAHQLAVKKRNLKRAQQRRIQQQQRLQEQRMMVNAARIHRQQQQAIQLQQQQPPQPPLLEHAPEETPPHEEDEVAVPHPPQVKKKDKGHHRRLMGFSQQPSRWRKVKSMCNLDLDSNDTSMIPVYPVSKRAKSASAMESPRSISMQDAQEVTSALLHVLDKKPGEKLVISKLLRGHQVTRLSTEDVSAVTALADVSESRSHGGLELSPVWSTDETPDASFQSFPPSSDDTYTEEVGHTSDTHPPVTTPTETSPPSYKTPSKSSNWNYHVSKIQKGAHLLAKELLIHHGIPSSSQSVLLSAPKTPANTLAQTPSTSSSAIPTDKCNFCMLIERSTGIAAYLAPDPEIRPPVKCTCGSAQEVPQRQSQEETSEPIPQTEVPPPEVAPATQPATQRRNTRFGGVKQGLWDSSHTFKPFKKK